MTSTRPVAMSEAGCEVWFYHLERATLDRVLPELLEKTLARGWRAVVRSNEPDRIDHLDLWLWAYREDSFLPHGVEGEPNDARQPVLLTTGREIPNAAHVLFVVDDADPGDVSRFARCILIFDGRDEARLAAARKRWSNFKAAGQPLAYWRQGQNRGWERQA